MCDPELEPRSDKKKLLGGHYWAARLHLSKVCRLDNSRVVMWHFLDLMIVLLESILVLSRYTPSILG